MAYSEFKLKELVKQFDLTLQENQDLFAHISEVESSEIVTYSQHQPKRYDVGFSRVRQRISRASFEVLQLFPSTAFYSEEHVQPHLSHEKTF
ncbi:MAG: hypothetical protein ACBR50_06530 [Microcoleus sp.]